MVFRGSLLIAVLTLSLPASAQQTGFAPDAAARRAPPAPAAGAEPPAPKQLAVGKEGLFQPALLLQGWLCIDQGGTQKGPATPCFGNPAQEWQSSFRLRRAEIRVKGEIIPKTFGYQVMLDPAKALKFGSAPAPVNNQATPPAQIGVVNVPTPPPDNAILQDFYITFLSDYSDVSLGQFKIPVSYEGFNSASKLLMPERTLVSRYYGDRRDMGVKAEKKFQYVGYVLGVFNGQGQNQLDSNNQKDLALRLEVYPIKDITVAAAGYAALGDWTEIATKDRVEADVKAEMEHALLQAEYIHGWDIIAQAAPAPAGTWKRVEGHGAYGAVGYTFAEKYQPVVRIGFLDPDVDTRDNTLYHYELGFNYYLRKDEIKFQTSYGLFTSGAAGTGRRAEFIQSVQVSF